MGCSNAAAGFLNQYRQPDERFHPGFCSGYAGSTTLGQIAESSRVVVDDRPDIQLGSSTLVGVVGVYVGYYVGVCLWTVSVG
jgi:hypothetical protein